MDNIEHLIFLIQEKGKRMSVEFDALKVATEKLLQAYKELQAENVSLEKAPLDPAPADVAELTRQITSVLSPPPDAPSPQ